MKVSFAPSGGQWKHSYDGKDPTVLADWEHGEFRPHDNKSVSMSESDREVIALIIADERYIYYLILSIIEN